MLMFFILLWFWFCRKKKIIKYIVFATKKNTILQFWKYMKIHLDIYRARGQIITQSNVSYFLLSRWIAKFVCRVVRWLTCRPNNNIELSDNSIIRNLYYNIVMRVEVLVARVDRINKIKRSDFNIYKYRVFSIFFTLSCLIFFKLMTKKYIHICCIFYLFYYLYT